MKRNSVLVLGTGLESEHAARLSRDCDVRYFTHYATIEPEFIDYAYGIGMEKIEKIQRWGDADIRAADLVATFDLGYGKHIADYRKKGRVCFGAGKGEELENHRFNFRVLQKKMGLRTQHTIQVKGITNLRRCLKDNPDQYVKLDIFRGTKESFYARDYPSVELEINKMEVEFGPFSEDYLFCVEEVIHDAIEPGTDGFFSNGWIEPSLWGFEEEGAYIGRYGNLPPTLLEDAKALAPLLSKLDYRGAISVEERTVSKEISYVIDITARMPYPLSAIYTESIKNYTEVMFGVARGEAVQIDPASTYVGCLPVKVFGAHKDIKGFIRLQFDPKLKRWVKIYLGCKEGKNWYACNSPYACVLVALGKDPQEVVDKLEALLEEVYCTGIMKDSGDLHKILETIEKAKGMGISF